LSCEKGLTLIWSRATPSRFERARLHFLHGRHTARYSARPIHFRDGALIGSVFLSENAVAGFQSSGLCAGHFLNNQVFGLIGVIRFLYGRLLKLVCTKA
jgi:hypothetical protein